MKLPFKLDKFDLFLIGFVIFLYAVIALLPIAPKKFGDHVFFKEAKIIAEVLHGVKQKEEIIISRAPGPVLFYAIPYSLIPSGSTDNQYWLAGLVWTICWICFSVLLIRRAAAILSGWWGGWFAAIISLFIPLIIYYSYGVNAEPVAFIASAIACYAWAKLAFSDDKTNSTAKALFLMCFGLTLVILARPNAILILPIGLLASIVMFLGKTDVERAKLTFMAVVITGIASVSCLQIVSIASSGGQQDNLYHVIFHGRFQYRTEVWDWRFWDNETRAGSADYELFTQENAILSERSRQEGFSLLQLKKEWAVQDALDHPFITIQQAAVRSLTLHLFLVNSKPPAAFRVAFIPGNVIFILFHIVLNLAYLVVLVSSLYFVFANWRRLFSYWMLWGLHPALLIFHALTYAEPRYMIPALPGLIIMTGAVWGTFFNKLKS